MKTLVKTILIASAFSMASLAIAAPAPGSTPHGNVFTGVGLKYPGPFGDLAAAWTCYYPNTVTGFEGKLILGKNPKGGATNIDGYTLQNVIYFHALDPSLSNAKLDAICNGPFADRTDQFLAYVSDTKQNPPTNGNFSSNPGYVCQEIQPCNDPCELRDNNFSAFRAISGCEGQ